MDEVKLNVELICIKDASKLNSESLMCKYGHFYKRVEGIPMIIDNKMNKSTKAFYENTPYFVQNYFDEVFSKTKRSRFSSYIFNTINKKGLTGDIGCGAGQDTFFLTKKGLSMISLDQSLPSLLFVKSLGIKNLLCASNLNLPFKKNTFDNLLSIGVIHHTSNPKKSFSELVRVLKPKGKLYISVYKKESLYMYMYNYVGSIGRMLIANSVGRIIINQLVIRVFGAIVFLFSKRRRDYSQIKNLFYDYFLVPIASFHSEEELREWARSNGAEFKLFKPARREMISGIVEKD